MKASELINLYNAGTRDFSRECLRGQNFAGKDLSGANLSSCDIRGANFTGANLSSCDIRGANFTGATLIDSDFSQAMAGLTLKSQIVLLFPVMIVVTLSGFLSGWSGSYIAGIFDRSTTEYIISGSLTVASLLIFCVTSYRKGLAAGVFAGICAGAFAEAFTGAFVGAFSGSFAITFAGAFAGAFAGSVTVAIGGIFAGVFTAAFSVGGALVGAFAGGFALGGVFATPLILLACVIAYRAMKGDPRDAWIRTFAIAFAATGGTTFKKANLTDAHFTEARLESTDFQEAILTRTCFKNAEELDRIRPGNTILYQPHIRELLRTGNGSEKSYVNANLQGANLDGSNLNEANLKQCNLNDASLRATNLEWANLTQVSVINTNFTNCHLTGACIEAWNIDQSTILDNVDCQYLFLLEKPGINGTRERRPHDPNKMFQTGDFEKLYREIINTVQLFLKNGINPEAFKQAFDKIVEENPNISYDNIQGIEKKGNDVLVTVEVPEDANKADIQNTFDEVYELRLKEAIANKLLEAEREHKKDIIRVVELLKPAPTNIINENKSMTNSSDNSKNITIRDIEAPNSVVNVGEISGEVSNNIQ